MQRNLPARGFSPGLALFGIAAVMSYGFWRHVQGTRERKYVFPIPPREQRGAIEGLACADRLGRVL
jgi:hypothetical protein